MTNWFVSIFIHCLHPFQHSSTGLKNINRERFHIFIIQCLITESFIKRTVSSIQSFISVLFLTCGLGHYLWICCSKCLKNLFTTQQGGHQSRTTELSLVWILSKMWLKVVKSSVYAVMSVFAVCWICNKMYWVEPNKRWLRGDCFSGTAQVFQ